MTGVLIEAMNGSWCFTAADAPAVDRVKKVADDAERIAAVQRRRGDASDRRGGGVVAGVKHGARRPEHVAR